jgi:LuxR family maltose regulon positive regulatory protein
LNEFEYLTLARLEIANPQVNALLARLLQAAEAQKRQGSALEIVLVQALAYEAQGNRPNALYALKHALSLSEPEDYIRIYIDEGPPIENLLNNIKTDNKKLKKYIQRLKAAFLDEKSQLAVTNQQSLIEPLSERELEVLKLLRTELSGPEIAGQLIVSLNTFRTHTKNIFNKLGVNNRRAAIRRADELDLF